jgi:nucleotide-binding universal stress UspA family protein
VTFTRLRKVLVPVDFSGPSRAAMHAAVELQGRLGGRITLCHVYQTPAYTFPEGVVLAGPDVLNDLAAQVERALDKWREEAELEGGVDIDTMSVMGPTHSEIGRIAQEGKYDLIVMGTHGLTGLKHLLLGSVAERVVRTAPCPVLTVHEPAHEEEAARP